MTLPMTEALSPLATRFGVDLTPFAKREQAYADMLSAALNRDDDAWAKAKARFHAKEGDSRELITLAFNPIEGRGTQRQRRLLRRLLRKRDGDLCCWCQEPMNFEIEAGSHWRPDFPTIEHIIPRRDGGSDGFDNLALAHKRCNQGRDAVEMKQREQIEGGRSLTATGE